MTKMTKRERFEAIAAFLAAAPANMDATPEGQNPEDFLAESIDFCLAEIALLAKRAAGPKGPTKTQIENAALKNEMLVILSGEPMKATALGNACGVSVQKASALLRQLVADGSVVRVEDGKDTLFALSE